MKILVVRKLSSMEFYYHNQNVSRELLDSKLENDSHIKNLEEILKKYNRDYDVKTRLDLTYDLVDRYDLVISAGGDGTTIATAAYNKDKPQLNLRTCHDSKGKLCQDDTEDVINAFFDGNYKIEKWTRQDVYFNDVFIGRALNETCIGEALKFTKMAGYKLYFSYGNKEYTDEQRNSGLIIATGTGSTGWPSLFDPYSREEKSFRFKALLPYEGNIHYGEGDYFKIEYKKHQGRFAIDTIDTSEYDLKRDSILEIKLSNNPLNVVIPLKK